MTNVPEEKEIESPEQLARFWQSLLDYNGCFMSPNTRVLIQHTIDTLLEIDSNKQETQNDKD